jgi:hypothetical protein
MRFVSQALDSGHNTHASFDPPLRKASAAALSVLKSVKTVTNWPNMIFCRAIPTPDAMAETPAIPIMVHSVGLA